MKAAGPSLSASQLVLVCVLGLSSVAALVAGARHLEARSVADSASPVQAATFAPRAFDNSPADREPTAAVQAFAPPVFIEPRPAAKPVPPPAAFDAKTIDPEDVAPAPQARTGRKQARTRFRNRPANAAAATAQAGDGGAPRRKRVRLVLGKRDSAGAICFRLKAGGGRCTQRL